MQFIYSWYIIFNFIVGTSADLRPNPCRGKSAADFGKIANVIFDTTHGADRADPKRHMTATRP